MCSLKIFRYQADHVYALSTVYFMCAVIGVFMISNLLVRFAPDCVKRTRPWRMFTSVSRYLSYHGFRSRALRYWSPTLGVVILGAVGAIFFFGRFIWSCGVHEEAN
jgi:ferric-chelate reductase